MTLAIVFCALGAVISGLASLICNTQYKKFANTNSGWLEFWLAARIIFLVVAALFAILLVLVVALVL